MGENNEKQKGRYYVCMYARLLNALTSESPDIPLHSVTFCKNIKVSVLNTFAIKLRVAL